ncbi:hypothetical protein D3C75_1011440 [compost metagenome]
MFPAHAMAFRRGPAPGKRPLPLGSEVIQLKAGIQFRRRIVSHHHFFHRQRAVKRPFTVMLGLHLAGILLQIEQLIAEAPRIQIAKGGRDLHHLRALGEIKPGMDADILQLADLKQAVDAGRHQGVLEQVVFTLLARTAHINAVAIGDIDMPAKIAKQGMLPT